MNEKKENSEDVKDIKLALSFNKPDLDESTKDMSIERMKKAIQYLHSVIPLMKEQSTLIAKLTRTKYDALRNEGFTEKQALELSKSLF